jgi:hypothetical protein
LQYGVARNGAPLGGRPRGSGKKIQTVRPLEADHLQPSIVESFRIKDKKLAEFPPGGLINSGDGFRSADMR